jgi:AcrR family transcriptional regulator
MDTKPQVSGEASDRQSRKCAQLEQHLVSVAFRLFEAHGFDSVTMEGIAHKADVAKATLYKHFPVKEALLARRFKDEIEEGIAVLDEELRSHRSFAARMRFLLSHSAAWHQARKAYMPHYLRFRRSLVTYGPAATAAKRHGSGTRQILESFIRDAQVRGEVSSRYVAADIAAMFEHMLVSAVVTWLEKPDRDLGQEFSFALTVLLSGVGTTVRGGTPSAERNV